MRAQINGPSGDRFDEILTPEAVDFLVALDSEFAARRAALLDTRRARRARYAEGEVPDFLPETAAVRTIRPGGWRRPRRAWSTGGSRSPGRPTAR
jgi:malate synthase